MPHSIGRRMLAEFLGAGSLAAVVIGSGIAAQTLSPGDSGLQLLENATATAAGLFAVILMVGPVSGGHLNPAVSLVDAAFGGVRWRDAAAYACAQVGGCVVGALAANLMFGLDIVSISTRQRASGSHFLSEIVATMGLVIVIFAVARTRPGLTAAAAGAYVGAAYLFTSSTGFANPALTIGRMLSDTFAGISPASVPSFIGAQITGAASGFLLVRALYPRAGASDGSRVVVPSDPAAAQRPLARGSRRGP